MWNKLFRKPATSHTGVTHVNRDNAMVETDDVEVIPSSPKSRQLPSSQLQSVFGEVNVVRDTNRVRVAFTFLMEPTGSASEGWQTGVALDASLSMLSAYGMTLLPGVLGDPPADLKQSYSDRGWMDTYNIGDSVKKSYGRNARIDLVEKGYFTFTPNDMGPLAQRVTSYLADNLDSDGGTSVIYWACGSGYEIEIVGDLTSVDCSSWEFSGPHTKQFGTATALEPAVRYFAERFIDAPNAMFIFITDGVIHDLCQVKDYSIKLCKEIDAGHRNPMKCVLIGMGSDIDVSQLEELDDLDSGTDVDLWDHKIATEMRQLIEIFAEVVTEAQVVAPFGRIRDDRDNVVASFADGLPAKVIFDMHPDAEFFELEVGDMVVRQSIFVV